MSLWKLDQAQIMMRSNSTLMQDGFSVLKAIWKIFSFPMYQIYHDVFRLQIHLPDRQQVRFRPHEPIANVLERSKKTMLTDFFYMNMIEHDA